MKSFLKADLPGRRRIDPEQHVAGLDWQVRLGRDRDNLPDTFGVTATTRETTVRLPLGVR